MLERFGTRIQLALIGAMVLAGLWARMGLPDGAQVPIHFNAHGEANGWASANVGLFVLPWTALVLLGVQWLLPHIDPRGDNLRRSAKAVTTVFVGVALVLCAAQVYVVARSLEMAGPAPKLPMLLMGGLFAFMGNVMGKLRSNFTVGIRTPWTLSSERVWDQTHRFAGKAFVGAGLLLLVLAMTSLAPKWQTAAIACAAIGAAGASVLKSYLLWREQQGGG